MKDKGGISITQKTILAFVGILILFLLSWFGTIKKTISKFDIVQNDKKLLENINADKINYEALENKTLFIDTIFKSNKELDIRYISKMCSEYKNVELISFPDAHNYETNDFIIKTYVVELKGNYFELLKLTKKIESNPDYGFLISLSFENKMNYKLKRDELYLRLYLQKYADL